MATKKAKVEKPKVISYNNLVAKSIVYAALQNQFERDSTLEVDEKMKEEIPSLLEYWEENKDVRISKSPPVLLYVLEKDNYRTKEETAALELAVIAEFNAISDSNSGLKTIYEKINRNQPSEVESLIKKGFLLVQHPAHCSYLDGSYEEKFRAAHKNKDSKPA